jgi:hypothetical protein
MVLSGYKTYVISALMIIKALYEMFTGDTGTIQAPDYNLLMEGLGLSALRAGVAKK